MTPPARVLDLRRSRSLRPASQNAATSRSRLGPTLGAGPACQWAPLLWAPPRPGLCPVHAVSDVQGWLHHVAEDSADRKHVTLPTTEQDVPGILHGTAGAAHHAVHNVPTHHIVPQL